MADVVEATEVLATSVGYSLVLTLAAAATPVPTTIAALAAARGGLAAFLPAAAGVAARPAEPSHVPSRRQPHQAVAIAGGAAGGIRGSAD